MQNSDGVLGRFQTARNLISTMLGAAENKHALKIGFLQKSDEQVKLLRPGDRVKRVINRLVNGTIHSALNALRILKRKRSDSSNLRRNGCGKEQRLAIFRTARDDVLDDRQESHVEHAIYFVENEDLNASERKFSALNVVH